MIATRKTNTSLSLSHSLSGILGHFMRHRAKIWGEKSKLKKVWYWDLNFVCGAKSMTLAWILFLLALRKIFKLLYRPHLVFSVLDSLFFSPVSEFEKCKNHLLYYKTFENFVVWICNYPSPKISIRNCSDRLKPYRLISAHSCGLPGKNLNSLWRRKNLQNQSSSTQCIMIIMWRHAAKLIR